MKKLLLFFALLATLFAADYSGFMKLKPGAWAKYIIHTDEGTMELVNKFVGTTTYKGKKVNIIETITKIGDMQNITQSWSAIDNDSLIRRIISKTPQGIFCMEEEMIGMSGMNEGPSYHTTTPKEYSPKKPNIKIVTYTLKNGKKIQAALFKDGSTEVLVSSQVPFGIVLVKKGGKKEMELVDFGYGAKPIISLDAAKSCGALPFPTM